MPVGSSTPVSGSGDAKKPQGKPISVEYPPNSGRMWLVVTEKTDGDAEIKAMMLGILQQTYTAGGEDAFKQVKTIRATPIQENHQVTRIDIKTSGGESPISTTIEKTHEGIEGVFEGIASFFAPLAPVKTTRPAAPITLTTTSPDSCPKSTPYLTAGSPAW